jgi:hypothetical protein
LNEGEDVVVELHRVLDEITSSTSRKEIEKVINRDFRSWENFSEEVERISKELDRISDELTLLSKRISFLEAIVLGLFEQRQNQFFWDNSWEEPRTRFWPSSRPVCIDWDLKQPLLFLNNPILCPQ